MVVDFLGGLLDALIGLVALVAGTWLVAQAVRRVLGVRVGWPRAFVVSAITILSLTGMVQWLVGAGHLRLNDADPAPVLLSFGLLTLWAFALAAAVLVGLEVIVPTGSLPSLRSALFGWGRRWRRARRYAAIMAIAGKHGIGAQVRGVRGSAGQSASELAVGLRGALNEAGVTFVKLGQMLSTRADLLPAPFIRELSHLTNRATPVAWDELRPVLGAGLGRPAGEAFAHVDAEPLAAASVAQVHAAELRDGRGVVVKVQRPDALPQVGLDLEILRRIARSLERNAPWARRLGVVGLADGFAESLREELDYRVEVDNMRALKASLDRRGVRIPEVEDALSSERVIVMERFDATPLSQASGLLAGMPAADRAGAAERLLRAALGNIVEDGIFHADLHPGNVVIWPDASVGLLDFGSVGRLDAVSRRTLGLLLWAIDADDPAMATDALLELLDRPDDLDDRALQRSLGTLVTRFRGGLGSGGSVAVFTELFALVVDHGFTVPPAVAAALRSLGALEGTLRLLDPGLDLVAAARSAGRDAVGAVTPERVKAEVTQKLMHLVPLLEHLPRRIDRITEDVERGRLTAHVRVVAHPDDRAFLSGLVQQLVIAVLAGSAVLGGILLVVDSGGATLMPGLTTHAFLGALLAFAGFVLALRAVALVFGRAGPGPFAD